MKLGEDNMKLGETIDYMMENRYDGTIENKDIICKGEYFYPEEDFCYYRIAIFRQIALGKVPMCDIDEVEWEEFNDVNTTTQSDSTYRWLSYEYEDRYGSHKKSVKEYNSIKNIERRCQYEENRLVMIELY